MKLISKLGLLAGAKLPRGYFRILRATAERDFALQAYAVPLKNVPGAQMVCDFREPVFTSIFRDGLIPHQAGQDTLYRRLIQSGDLVFDVGANVGYTALLFAHAAGPTGRVFAFEPGRRAFGYLTRNVAHNRALLPTICPKQIALSDHPGEAVFFDSDSSNLSSLERVSGAEEYVVRLTTLDALADEHGAPQFIKIDVEGHEPKVFRGMSATLNAARPPIIAYEALTAEANDACLAALTSQTRGNYTFYRIAEDGTLADADSVSGTSDYLAMPAWASDRLS